MENIDSRRIPDSAKHERATTEPHTLFEAHAGPFFGIEDDLGRFGHQLFSNERAIEATRITI